MNATDSELEDVRRDVEYRLRDAHALAERYVTAFMGDHFSATVYRERLVEMVTRVALEAERRAS